MNLEQIKIGIAEVYFVEGDDTIKMIYIGCLYSHPKIKPDTRQTIKDSFKNIRPNAELLSVVIVPYQKSKHTLGKVVTVK